MNYLTHLSLECNQSSVMRVMKQLFDFKTDKQVIEFLVSVNDVIKLFKFTTLNHNFILETTLLQTTQILLQNYQSLLLNILSSRGLIQEATVFLTQIIIDVVYPDVDLASSQYFTPLLQSLEQLSSNSKDEKALANAKQLIKRCVYLTFNSMIFLTIKHWINQNQQLEFEQLPQEERLIFMKAFASVFHLMDQQLTMKDIRDLANLSLNQNLEIEDVILSIGYVDPKTKQLDLKKEYQTNFGDQISLISNPCYIHLTHRFKEKINMDENFDLCFLSSVSRSEEQAQNNATFVAEYLDEIFPLFFASEKLHQILHIIFSNPEFRLQFVGFSIIKMFQGIIIIMQDFNFPLKKREQPEEEVQKAEQLKSNEQDQEELKEEEQTLSDQTYELYSNGETLFNYFSLIVGQQQLVEYGNAIKKLKKRLSAVVEFKSISTGGPLLIQRQSSIDQSKKEQEEKQKKLKLKQKQEEIMKQFSQKQFDFMSQLQGELSMSSLQKSDSLKISDIRDQDDATCPICSEKIKKDQIKVFPLYTQVVNTYAYLEKNVNLKLKEQLNGPDKTHINFFSCCHAYHQACWEKYAQSNEVKSPNNQFLYRNQMQVLCTVCKRLCNSYVNVQSLTNLEQHMKPCENQKIYYEDRQLELLPQEDLVMSFQQQVTQFMQITFELNQNTFNQEPSLFWSRLVIFVTNFESVSKELIASLNMSSASLMITRNLMYLQYLPLDAFSNSMYNYYKCLIVEEIRHFNSKKPEERDLVKNCLFQYMENIGNFQLQNLEENALNLIISLLIIQEAFQQEKEDQGGEVNQYKYLGDIDNLIVNIIALTLSEIALREQFKPKSARDQDYQQFFQYCQFFLKGIVSVFLLFGRFESEILDDLDQSLILSYYSLIEQIIWNQRHAKKIDLKKCVQFFNVSMLPLYGTFQKSEITQVSRKTYSVDLPLNYLDFRKKHAECRCNKCGETQHTLPATIPNKNSKAVLMGLASCLLCGMTLCKTFCENQQGLVPIDSKMTLGNLNMHAYEYHRGASIFVGTNTPLLIFIHYPKNYIYVGLYFNKFGDQVSQIDENWEKFTIDLDLMKKVNQYIIFNKIPIQMVDEISGFRQNVVKFKDILL